MEYNKERFPLKKLKRELPFIAKHCFLDSAAQGPMPLPTISKAFELLGKLCYNGPNISTLLTQLEEETSQTRMIFSRYFNAPIAGTVFIRSVAEAVNTILAALPSEYCKDEVVVTQEENAAVYIPVQEMAKRTGAKINYISIAGSKQQIIDRFENAITEKTKLVLISHVTHVSGTCVPITEIARIANRYGAVSIFDGAQACGQLPLDFTELDCDFYICAGYKWLLGYLGTGVMLMKEHWARDLKPFYAGAGSEKEYDYLNNCYEFKEDGKKFEYGSRYWPLYCALGVSLEYLWNFGFAEIQKKNRFLTMLCLDRLSGIDDIIILSPGKYELSSGICAFTLPKFDVDDFVSKMWENNKIVVRGRQSPWCPVNSQSVRVSANFFNTEEDIEYFVAATKEYLKK